ncbi:DUF6597 domain-containing transcriptional factor [Paenibacillus elgii]
MTRYRPAMPLAQFVDCFWYMEGYRPPHSRELALPDGSVEIVINLRGGVIRLSDRDHRAFEYGSSAVCGPHSQFFVIDTAQECSVIIPNGTATMNEERYITAKEERNHMPNSYMPRHFHTVTPYFTVTGADPCPVTLPAAVHQYCNKSYTVNLRALSSEPIICTIDLTSSALRMD